MKFMKIGSKPDSFKTDGNNVRYVENELASDISVNVDGSRFCLHKFPLLSKCAYLQKLLATTEKNNNDEVDISGIPGGATAFETCAKFCYGMTVTLSAYNVVATRCSAEYLGMSETVEKGNLIYKIDVFLNSSVFRSWKDSIIVLQTTKPFLPLSEDLKLVSLCIDSIATKACVDVSRVEWSYTYNRKKLADDNNGGDFNGVRSREVPYDWWVEDLCELEIDIYKRVVMNIKTKGIVASEVIGEALKAYAYRRLSGFNKGVMEFDELVKQKSVIETLVWLLPGEKDGVSCSFLLKLLKAVTLVDSGDLVKEQLVKRIGQQLEEASVSQLLIKSKEGSEMLYDVDLVQKIVVEFMTRDHNNNEIEVQEDGSEDEEMKKPGILSEASKLMVAKLIDSYLTEISKDPNLQASKFIDLAEMVSSVSRPAHDGLYRAIDMYLKEHPGITKGDKKRMCKLMDCRKLSVEACMHAVQNDRLPLRVVVQVLFFEQVRAAASSGSSTPDLPKGARELRSCGTYGSSRSVPTVMEDEWDTVATAEEMKAVKSEIAALKLQGNGEESGRKSMDRAALTAISKVKSLIKSKKMFGKKLQSQNRGGGATAGGGGAEKNGSDSSESVGSVNAEENGKGMSSGNLRRVSVS